MGDRPSGRIEPVNSLASLAELHLSEQNLDSVLGYIGRLAVRVLEGWNYAAATIVEGGKVVSYGTTDDRINEVDQSQYDAEAGPCFDCLRGGRVEYFDGTPTERWASFGQVAAQHGIRAVVSFPLRVGEEAIGALNFYSTKVDALRPGQREEGLLFASHAAVTLANVKELLSAKEQIDQLEEGLITRTMIGQATGLLMAEDGLTSEEAFQKLVKVSQHSQLKLRDIAQRYLDAWETRAGGHSSNSRSFERQAPGSVRNPGP